MLLQEFRNDLMKRDLATTLGGFSRDPSTTALRACAQEDLNCDRVGPELLLFAHV
jgi:hypothetical protein